MNASSHSVQRLPPATIHEGFRPLCSVLRGVGKDQNESALRCQCVLFLVFPSGPVPPSVQESRPSRVCRFILKRAECSRPTRAPNNDARNDPGRRPDPDSSSKTASRVGTPKTAERRDEQRRRTSCHRKPVHEGFIPLRATSTTCHCPRGIPSVVFRTPQGRERPKRVGPPVPVRFVFGLSVRARPALRAGIPPQSSVPIHLESGRVYSADSCTQQRCAERPRPAPRPRLKHENGKQSRDAKDGGAKGRAKKTDQLSSQACT